MGTLTKQLIGKEDLSVQYNTNDPEQFSRLNSVGGTINLYKIPDIWTGMGRINVGKVGNAIWGLNEHPSINALIDSIGLITNTTVIIDDAQTLTANLTIPSNINLVILKGGSIVKASTYTLTINGPFEAGLYQVFSGFDAGDVTFGNGAVKEAYPEWWGNNTTPGTTEMSTAIQSAFLAFPLTPANKAGRKIRLSDSRYKITSPVDIPDAAFCVDGMGQASVIEAVGCSAFTIKGNKTTGSIFKDFYILGDGSANKSAFDTSPTTPTETAAKIKWSNVRIGGFDRPFSVPNLQIGVFEDLTINGVEGKCIFYIHPVSGSGQCSNANRVLRGQFTGKDVAMFDYALPTATERMGNWIFRDCDIQFSGTTTPITYPDVFFVLENCEFENSTADHLVVLTYVPGVCVASNALLIGNYLTGGDGVTHAKVRLEGATPTIPYRVTLINNDAGSASFKLIEVDYDSGTNGPILLMNNQGIIGSNTNGRFINLLGDTDTIVNTLTPDSVTPSVALGTLFKTANTVPTTIWNLAGGHINKTIRILIQDNNTTINFTTGFLKGNAGVNWSPSAGDWMECTLGEGGYWYCSVHDCTA